MGRRIRWLGVVMILCFALVLVQLVNVQYRRAPALASSVDNPRNVVHSVDNRRGTISAADGTILAASVPSPIPPYKDQRIYPEHNLYSDITGYDSLNLGVGGGIEKQYNDYLSLHKPGKPSSLSQFFENLLNPPPSTTDNVQLTVQPYLQTAAAQALAGIPNPNQDGAIVALNPSTGAIDAMYSNPSYDPNLLASPSAKVEGQADLLDFQVKDHEGFYAGRPIATGYTFQPGSTSKVVTSEAALNLDPPNANFSAPTTKCLKFNNSNVPLCNDDNTGPPCGGTIAQMLPPSCDPGFAELGIQVGGDTLTKQGALFGYNQVPPVDLPDVVASQYPLAAALAPTAGGQAYTGYTSIGQSDVFTTALQNALVASAIADHGTIMTPHLMTQIRDDQGGLVSQYTPHPWLQAVSAPAAQAITGPMQAVASQAGATAYGIFPPSWDVAVKTGTAQVGSGNQDTDDWMIGFAPAYDPVIAVAVVVPYQAFSASGATVAGPIMKTMLGAALAHVVAAPKTPAAAG